MMMMMMMMMMMILEMNRHNTDRHIMSRRPCHCATVGCNDERPDASTRVFCRRQLCCAFQPFPLCNV